MELAFALVVGLAPATELHAWQMKQAPLMTQWASQIDTNNPLPEYPRPQLVRSNWLNLNGIWQFQAGAANDAVPTNQTLSGAILVPYPMESAISGVMQVCCHPAAGCGVSVLPSQQPVRACRGVLPSRRRICLWALVNANWFNRLRPSQRPWVFAGILAL